MEIVIFCDEKRSELLPLTEGIPVPMLKICDNPIISYFIKRLPDEITGITAVSAHGLSKMRNEFKNSLKFHNLKNRFSCNDDILIAKGNFVTDMDFGALIKNHFHKNAEITTVKKYNNYSPFPIYIIRKDIFSGYLSKYNGILDYNKLISFISGYRENLFKTDAYFLEIKGISDFIKANCDVLSGKISLNEKSEVLKSKGVILGNNSMIEVGAVITPPVYIGDNTIVESGARLGPFAVVGAYSLVKGGGTIEHSVTGKGCYIDKDSKITGSVLDSRVKICKKAVVSDGCIIGKNSIVGENSVISPGIKIFANKKIHNNSEILSHFIYDNNGDTMRIFENETRLSTGTEFTPELLLKLGSALTATLNAGKIAIGVDSSPMAKMSKYSVVSGIMSLGGTAYDFGENLISVFRSALLFYKTSGGIYISFGDDYIKISLFGANGSYPDEKTLDKINYLVNNPEYTNLGAKYINAPLNLENYRNYYYKFILHDFKNKKINRFLYYNSGSHTVKNYIETVSDSLSIKSVELKEKAFRLGVVSTVIPKNGEGISIFSEEGERLNEDTIFLIKLLILISERIYKPVVIPENISNKVVHFAKENNMDVIISGTKKEDFLNAVLENGSRQQYMLFFDEIYGLMKILEFISANNTELSLLKESLPEIFKSGREITAHTSDASKIFEKLLKEDNGVVEKSADSIKISKDKDSWVLITSNLDPYSFSVVAESYGEEYAKELCDFYADKINKIK